MKVSSHSLTFALRSSRVVTPEGVRPACIHVENGVVASVAAHADAPGGIPLVDVSTLAVMPGLVDTHVHINEPGRTEWEGFETATSAAAAGGITCLVEMPLNSSPVTTSPEALARKIRAAAGKLRVDCGFHAGLVPENRSALGPLLARGVFGVKAFLVHSGIDEFPNVAERDLREAMPGIAASGLPLLVHAELQTPRNSPAGDAGGDPRRYAVYLASRPRSWEHDAISLMIGLCREYGCRVHIVHLSSADAIPMIRQARREGLPLTVETCPHYLVFDASEIPDGDTRYKCAPPIRERDNRERLWEGLRAGDIDFIVSDHSPSLPAMKCLDTGDFMKAWGGIASLQFSLQAVWTEAGRRGFGLEDVCRWMCGGPAELCGLKGRKGAIAPGCDADFVVWEPEASIRVSRESILHRHALTPYEGRVLSGKIESTYLRGRQIVRGGTPIGEPAGRVMQPAGFPVESGRT